MLQPDTGSAVVDGSHISARGVDLDDLATRWVAAIAVVEGDSPVWVRVQSLLEKTNLVMLGVEVDLGPRDSHRLFLGDLVTDAAAGPCNEQRQHEDRAERGQLEQGAVPKRAPGSSVGRQRSP